MASQFVTETATNLISNQGVCDCCIQSQGRSQMSFVTNFTQFVTAFSVTNEQFSSSREFFDPYICLLEKENCLSHSYQCRSHPCACISDKFFSTEPGILLQLGCV